MPDWQWLPNSAGPEWGDWQQALPANGASALGTMRAPAELIAQVAGLLRVRATFIVLSANLPRTFNRACYLQSAGGRSARGEGSKGDGYWLLC